MSWDDEHIRNKYELAAIQEERVELWNQVADLKRENSKLSVEIAKLVGMSVVERAHYKSDIQEQIEDIERQLEQARLHAEKVQASYERRIKEGQDAHKRQIDEIKAEFEEAMRRLRESQKAVIESQETLKELEEKEKGLTKRFLAAIERASQDSTPLILKPAVYGVGIDLPKLYRRLRGWLKR